MQILSLGYNRQLLNHNLAEGDVSTRMNAYAKLIEKYFILVHSLKKHDVPSYMQLGSNMFVYASNGFNKLFSFIKLLFLGRRIISQNNVALIQAQDPLFTGLLALCLSSVNSIPYNVCVYGTNPFDKHFINESKSYSLLKWIMILVLRKADGIQVDGNKVKNSLIENGIREDKLHFKPMIPQNIEEFLAIKKDQYYRDNNAWRFLFVGRLSHQKNLFMLLDILRLLKLDKIEFKLDIIGDGPLKDALKSYCSKSDLVNEVVFHGRLPHSNVIEAMKQADIFLLPSNYEGFPRVLMEAASAGLAIVSTDVSGAQDTIVQDRSGIIVSIGDKTAFKNAILEMIRKLEQQGSSIISKIAKSKMSVHISKYSNLELQLDIWNKILASVKTA